MDTLIVISTTASILFGIGLSCLGYRGLDDEDHWMKVMENAHLFEISATILVIISLGKLLESYTKKRTIQKLSELASKSVSNAILFTPNDG